MSMNLCPHHRTAVQPCALSIIVYSSQGAGGSGPCRPASEQLSRKAGSILGSRDEHGQRCHFPIPASTMKSGKGMANPGSMFPGRKPQCCKQESQMAAVGKERRGHGEWFGPILALGMSHCGIPMGN